MSPTVPVVVLHVKGTLDAAGAVALQHRFDAEDGTHVVVADLGEVSQVQPVGLLLLAHDLRRRVRPRIQLRGLREHHVRMLHCFGLHVRTAREPPPALA